MVVQVAILLAMLTQPNGLVIETKCVLGRFVAQAGSTCAASD